MDQGNGLQSEQAPLDLFASGGEMGERTRSFDWAHTPLGPIEGWPQALMTVVHVMLCSRYAMWLGWGPEFTFFYNDAYARMTLGPKHPWALGRSASEVWSEIWGDIGPRAESVVRSGQATWDEGLLLFLERRGFSEETYHTFSYSPVPDDLGTIGGMLCVVTEDTERTIGERRLKTLRELASRTSDEPRSVEDECQSAAGILASNPHDVPFILIYLLDPECLQLTLMGCSGVSKDTPISPLTVGFRDVETLWPFLQAANTGKAVEVDDLPERFGPLPGGAWQEPSKRAVVLPMARPGQSQVAGFVVAGVSSRRPLDDGYRGFLDLLTGQVATAVANARAYEEERSRAEKLAELDRAKTAFFSNVSHEFRTPLTLMLGPVEDILAKPEGGVLPENRELLKVVNRNGLRLLRLVNTLLDFSRIEAGRVRASYRPTDLAALTSDLASVFRSACERAGLGLVVDCPPLPEPAYIDREMWEKVVLNLLSNAFKFTFDGEIVVTLRRVGRVVELRVRDTGTGIPEEEISRLFERFHRIENARGRTHEGSGIGLALVQEVVKLHGGSVSAESVVGQGTTFVVTIPLGSAHLPFDQIVEGRVVASLASGAGPFVEEALRWLPGDEQTDMRLSELPTHDEFPPTPDPRPLPIEGSDYPLVLLADDNADMRQYVARLLSNHFRVDAVADGEAALASARVRTPDLILTDVMMPRLDGFGLLRALRSDPRTSGVPVIMLSARAGEESRVEGMEAGADDYLVKPFGARELMARVSAHLQMAKIRRLAGQSLRESEERLRMALTAARMVAWQWNPADGSLHVSENAVDVFGLPEGIGLVEIDQGLALLHPDDVADYRETFGRAIEERGSYLTHYRLIRPDDGRVLWMEERGHAICDESGRVAKLAGVVMDVTESMRAEEGLRQARSRLESTLSVGEIGTWEFEVANNVVTTDRNLARIYGLTPEGPREESVEFYMEIIHPEDRRRVTEAVGRALESGETYEAEYRLVMPDRSLRWVVARARVVRDESSQDVRMPGVVVDITKLKRTEEELRETRSRLDSTLAAGEVGTWEFDPVANVVLADPNLARMFGVTPEEAAGGPIGCYLRSIHPDDRDRVAGAIERSMDKGDGFEADYRLVGSDGTVRWVVARGRVERDGTGRAVRLPGVVIDVTGQRRAEAELRASEDQRRIALDSAELGAWNIDSATNVLTSDERFRTIFHGSTAPLGFDQAFAAIHPDDRERVRVSVEAAMRPDDPAPYSEEYRVVHPDGSVRWVFGKGRANFEPTGTGRRLVSLDGTVADITDRKHGEQQLRESEERLRFALRAGQMGTWDLDLESGVLTCSETCKANYGRGPSDSLTYDELASAVLQEDRPFWHRAVDEAVERASGLDVEYRCRWPDGSVHWVCVRASCAGDEMGRTVAMSGVSFNIDERKRAEEALLVADRQKDEFLATLAHELRNPLAPVRNGLQIMKIAGDDRQAVEEARALMERQVTHMVRLIDDLMDVSRITRNKLELRREWVELATVIRNAVETSRKLVEDAGHELSVTLPARPIFIDADVTRLAQVFSNLLNNAAKYTERGGDIALVAERQGSDVLVTVRDNGVGIPAEMLPEVFAMFTQVDRSLERSQGGLGIGLSLVKTLVEMHEGSVEARSGGHGQGSEFIVRLPIVLNPSIQPASSERGINPVIPAVSRRILVVDDNLDSARTLARLLKLLGHEIRTANDGGEAVEVAEEYRPELMFLDIGLPVLNGYDVAKVIRSRPWGRDLTIIALTGWGQAGDRRRSKEAGIDDHLVKPVDPAVLEKLLSELRRGPDIASV